MFMIRQTPIVVDLGRDGIEMPIYPSGDVKTIALDLYGVTIYRPSKPPVLIWIRLIWHQRGPEIA